MTFLFLFQGVIFEIRSVMLWVCGTGVFNMWTTGVFPGPLRLASWRLRTDEDFFVFFKKQVKNILEAVKFAKTNVKIL